MSTSIGDTQSFFEAGASFNTKFITPNGFLCQITIRGDNGKDLLQKGNSALEYLLEQGCTPYGYTRENVIPENHHQVNDTENHPSDESSFCPIHQCQMKKWEKGGKVWFSHKTEDGWCSGKQKIDRQK